MSLGRRRRIFDVFNCSALDLILREAFFDGGGKPSDDLFHRQSVPLKVGEICVQMYVRTSPFLCKTRMKLTCHSTLLGPLSKLVLAIIVFNVNGATQGARINVSLEFGGEKLIVRYSHGPVRNG